MSKCQLNNNKRKVHLDLLRLLAIFLVIFNHTGNCGYMLFTAEMKSPISLVYMMTSIFCKISVPIFFMISGALLLKKEESLKQLFVKRILRIIIVLFLISIPYYYWLHRDNGVDVFSFIKWIYSNSASTSLWYLYSYIALLLMLPFLRSMVKNMKKQEFIYLIIGFIVFVGFLPCLEYLVFNQTKLIHESFSPVLFMTQNVFFALVGYFFEHIYDNVNNKRFLIIISIFSLLAILFTCFMTYYQAQIGDRTPLQLECFFDSFICIPSISVYLLMKQISKKIKNERIIIIISVIGSSVFGVYLIEKIVRAAVDNVYYLFLPYLGSFISSFIWCAAVLCVSLMIIIPLKHIPIISKIVNKFI